MPDSNESQPSRRALRDAMPTYFQLRVWRASDHRVGVRNMFVASRRRAWNPRRIWACSRAAATIPSRRRSALSNRVLRPPLA